VPRFAAFQSRNRYPTPLTVSMYLAQGPSFLRSETIWTSTGDQEVRRVIPHADSIYLLVHDRYRSPNNHIVRLDRDDPTQAIDVVDFQDITSLVVSGDWVYFSAIAGDYNGIFFAERCGCP